MTRDDIINLMQQACDPDKKPAWHNEFWTITQQELERFADLVLKAERKPLTDDDLEPLRIRIMGEAYNAADEGQSEAYNAIKVLCAVLLDLVKRAVTSLDTDNSKEAQLDYIAQQIKNVVSSFNISKSLPVADTESDVLTATYMLGLHAGKKAAQRKPLTDEEILKMWDDTRNDPIAPSVFCLIACVRHVERAHGIGDKE
jgi:hypothetical protein